MMKHDESEVEVAESGSVCINNEIKNAIMKCWKQTGLAKFPLLESNLNEWLSTHEQHKVCIFAHH